MTEIKNPGMVYIYIYIYAYIYLYIKGIIIYESYKLLVYKLATYHRIITYYF